MLIGLFILLGTGFLWVVQGVLFSLTVRRGSAVDLLVFLQLSAVLAAVISWMILPDFAVIAEGQVSHGAALAGVQFASGLLSGVGYFSMRRGMAAGHHGVVWTLAQSAMIFPFLYAVAWMGEPLEWAGGAGIVLILASVLLFSRVNVASATEKDEASSTGPAGKSRAWLGFGLLTLLLFGVAQILASAPSFWKGWSDQAHLRVPFYNTGVAACYLLAGFPWRRKPDGRVVLFAAMNAAAAIVALFAIFKGMDLLSALARTNVVYPVVVATSMAGFAIYARAWLKERPGKIGYAAIMAAVLGVLLLAIRR
ncbi:MAG: hypothetical protein IT443_10775 [Phycisphaeraceae bacterium]|nr:hypothetical protein [Phycisphaeraceae bacterium]